MTGLVERMVERELSWFATNDYRGRPDSPAFTITSGSIPAMVSAPHAVTHWRDGRMKPSDDYTGPVALAVADLTGAHAIIATGISYADPNWDALDESEYKQALVDHVRGHDIRLLLDIHGMVAASPYLVALGTAGGLTCQASPGLEDMAVDVLTDGLADARARLDKGVALNPPGHAARGENTIAMTVARECGICCVQIELATQVRVPSIRGLHIPKDDPAPFSGDVRSKEIEARLNCSPDTVEGCVVALAALVDRFLQEEPGVSLP